MEGNGFSCGWVAVQLCSLAHCLTVVLVDWLLAALAALDYFDLVVRPRRAVTHTHARREIKIFSRRPAHVTLHLIHAEWFPNGVREGHEFCIGSRDGEAGQSLRIRLTGDKAGVCSDYSDGEAGGDLISLYAFVNSLSPGRACAALAERLGIPLTPRDKPSGNGSAPIVLKPKQSPNCTPAQTGKGVGALAEKNPRMPWEPLLPVPPGAGPAPQAHVVRDRPEALWEYRDVDGQLLGVIYRFLHSDEGKEVLPCVYARNPDSGRKEWRWMAFPEPRPLYLRGDTVPSWTPKASRRWPARSCASPRVSS